MRLITLSVAALVVLGSASLGTAGVVMKFTAHGTGDDAKPMSGSMEMQGDSVRVDNEGTTMIFRGDKQVVWVIPAGSDSYMEMTKDSMKQAAAGMDAAMAAMKDQLANMPPEQRAMVEKMMAQRAQPAAAPAPVSETLKPTGKTETIAGHATTAYDSYQGAERVRESWVADWKVFDLTAADMRPLEEMADFMSALAPGMAKRMDTGFAAHYSGKDALPGVPLRVVAFSKTGDWTHEITSLQRQDVAAARFEVPAGLTKEDAMSEMQGHQGR